MALLFHDDDALTDIRPGIFDYGVTDFETQMEKAEAYILRKIEANWYRARANDYGVNWRNTPFDSALLLTVSQLREAAAYKSLELICIYLMKESGEPDAFERQGKNFSTLYEKEIKEVLASGIDYDWDSSGAIDAGENIQPPICRLVRV